MFQIQVLASVVWLSMIVPRQWSHASVSANEELLGFFENLAFSLERSALSMRASPSFAAAQ